jgi:hypothetical protein
MVYEQFAIANVIFLGLKIYLINSSSAHALLYRYSGLLESDPTISISSLSWRIKLNIKGVSIDSTTRLRNNSFES